MDSIVFSMSQPHVQSVQPVDEASFALLEGGFFAPRVDDGVGFCLEAGVVGAAVEGGEEQCT